MRFKPQDILTGSLPKCFLCPIKNPKLFILTAKILSSELNVKIVK